jgi:hypothetical protein
MTIDEIRAKYPQYKDVSDFDLLMGLHKAYYPTMHVKDFLAQIDGAQNIGATRNGSKMADYYVEQVSKPKEGETSDQTGTRLGGTYTPDKENMAESALRSGFQGLTFGFGDEAVAAGAAAIDPNGTYDQYLDAERGRLERGRDQFPKTSMASEIGGAILAPGLGLGAARGASVPAKMATGAAVGGLQGGLYGFGAGEGGTDARVKSAQDMGLMGAMVGGAIPGAFAAGTGIANKVRDATANSALIKAAPTIDDLAMNAGVIFDRADNAAPMPRAPLTAAAPGMIDRAQRGGMDDMLTPGAHRVTRNLEDLATNPNPTMTFRELDIMRKQAGIPAGNFVANPTEAKIGATMVQDLDDVFNSAAPGMASEVSDARNMWGKMRRAETIDRATSKADIAASGLENGTRNYLRSLLNDPRRLRGFSGDEVDQMRRVVKGTLPANIMKKISKLGFGVGQQGNFLGGSIGAGAGAVAGGPVGAMAVPALGYAAGKGSEKLAGRDVEILRAMVLGGQKAQRSGALTPTQAMLLEKIFGPASRAANPIIGQQ